MDRNWLPLASMGKAEDFRLRTAEKRYTQVMALRQDYATQQLEVASLFDTLERHWPRLVNDIESQVVPRTNNVVELVICRTCPVPCTCSALSLSRQDKGPGQVRPSTGL